MRTLSLKNAVLLREYLSPFSGRNVKVWKIPYDISSMDVPDISQFMRDAEKGLRKHFVKYPDHPVATCSGPTIWATDFWPGAILVHIEQ